MAAFAYSYPLDSLIKQFKYKQHIRLIAPLTNVLADQIQSRCNDLPEVMIPVPLHKHRLRSRGFNQSQLICSVLSSTLRLKIDADAVIRIRDTLPMYELDADQRSENIKGAFRLQRQCQYKSVAFIDDIITSGSTMNELAGLFLETGVKRVEFWALARAD